MGCCCSQKAIAIENSDGGAPECAEQGSSQINKSLSDLLYFTDNSGLSDFVNQEEPVMNGYRFVKELGQGAYSRVFKVIKEKTGEEFAAKIYDNRKISKPSLTNDDPLLVCVQRELEILAKHRHKYLIPLADAFNDNSTNSLLILTPFAKCGSLKSMLDKHKVTRDQAKVCFLEIAIAMEYLHKHNIVHRDIKPENMLCFGEDKFVISDMSVSQEIQEDEKLYDTKGTPLYFSPEECLGHAFNPKPADVWKYGVSLYVSMFGEFPFGIGKTCGFSLADAIIKVSESLKSNKLKFPKKTSHQLIDLLKKILRNDASQRITFSEIVKHKWFNKVRERVQDNDEYDEYYDEEEENEGSNKEEKTNH